jgi:transglutaminase-like putative cysteine protease
VSSPNPNPNPDPGSERLWTRGSPWRVVAVPVTIALAAVGAIAASRVGIPLAVGALAGGTAALLGVFALPSLSTRRVVVVLLGLAGLGALRHASYSGSDTSPLLLCWAAATLVALLLVDRTGAEQVKPLALGAPLARRSGEVFRLSVTTAVIVAVAVVALGPTLTQHLGRHVWPGVDPSIGDIQSASTTLRNTDELDMTQRPHLSDRVVFTVTAPRPEFWRGETFDVWNGHAWTQSGPPATSVPHVGDTSVIRPEADDVGAFTGPPMRQTFHLESGFSDVIFAAPSPVSVEADRLVQQRDDGTASVVEGFGTGATYTVTSRSVLSTESSLRATNARRVPAAVLRQFAREPTTTPRVRTLARDITASAPTTYDKIRALENWMSAHVRYSIDAPIAPRGVDVVDDFLFRSRLGWCEQVASSLVVMARSVGIPARLATGFVPGTRDALTGQFTVRERDAHAWAEIYFPGVGWQPFDPTASVPLAGDTSTNVSWLETARNHAVEFGLIAVALVLAVAAAPDVIAWARRRRARRRSSWAARRLARLERIGRRAGRARAPSETPREYADALAVHLNDARLRTVGETLDADGFSLEGAPPSARADADAVLSSL